jgi:hypothetical protein
MTLGSGRIVLIAQTWVTLAVGSSPLARDTLLEHDLLAKDHALFDA